MRQIPAHQNKALSSGAGETWQLALAVETARNGTLYFFSSHDDAGDGSETRACVLDWGELVEAIDRDAAAPIALPSDISITLSHELSRVIADDEIENRPVSIYRFNGPIHAGASEYGYESCPWETDAPAEHRHFKIFEGVAGAVSGDGSSVAISISDPGRKYVKSVGEPITSVDFPTCPDRCLGMARPIVFGELDGWTPLIVTQGKNAKLIAAVGQSDASVKVDDASLLVYAGQGTTLSSGITANDTIIPVAGASGFNVNGGILVIDPSGTPEYVIYRALLLGGNSFIQCVRGVLFSTPVSHSSGVIIRQLGAVRIDDEVILYESISANTLQNCMRGAAGTTARGHREDVDVQPSWCTRKFLVADHPSFRLDDADIYVADAATGKLDRQGLPYLRVSLDDTALLPGEHLTTVKFFPDAHNETEAVPCDSPSSAGNPWVEWTGIMNSADGDPATYATYQVNWAGGPGSTVASISASYQGAAPSLSNVKAVFACSRSEVVSLNPNVTYEVYHQDSPSTAVISTLGEHVTKVPVSNLTTTGASAFYRRNIIHKTAHPDAGSGAAEWRVMETWFEALIETTDGREIIEKIVACDLSGLKDDASGTYSGTPEALIENPADLLHYMLAERIGVPEDAVDSDSFVAARAQLAGWKFAGVVSASTTGDDLIQRICRQCNSRLVWEDGRAVLLVEPLGDSAADTPVIEFTEDDILAGTFSWSRTSVNDVINDLIVYYRPAFFSSQVDSLTMPAFSDSDAERSGRSETESKSSRYLAAKWNPDDAAFLESRARYGTTNRAEIHADFIRDDATATNLFNSLRDSYAFIRWIARFVTALKGDRAQRGDLVSVTHSGFPSSNGKGCVGKLFLVTSVTKIGPYQVRIEAISLPETA